MSATENSRVQLSLDIARLRTKLKNLPWYCFKARHNLKKEIKITKSILTILEKRQP